MIMKKGKLVAIIGAIVLTLVILIGGSNVYLAHKYKNTFDEMYYAWAEHDNIFLKGGADFYLVKALSDSLPHPNKPPKPVITTGLSLRYDTEYLRETFYLSLFINLEEEIIAYTCATYVEPNEIVILNFNYNKNERTIYFKPIDVLSEKLGFKYSLEQATAEQVIEFLKMHNITKEDIREYQDYFLYEIAIKTWIEGNGTYSRFTKDNIGEFTIIDDTFSLLGEELLELFFCMERSLLVVSALPKC